jgi:hypothetical protein
MSNALNILEGAPEQTPTHFEIGPNVKILSLDWSTVFLN